MAEFHLPFTDRFVHCVLCQKESTTPTPAVMPATPQSHPVTSLLQAVLHFSPAMQPQFHQLLLPMPMPLPTLSFDTVNTSCDTCDTLVATRGTHCCKRPFTSPLQCIRNFINPSFRCLCPCPLSVSTPPTPAAIPVTPQLSLSCNHWGVHASFLAIHRHQDVAG